MTFTPSVTPDVTDTLPNVLGYSGASQTTNSSDIRWDIAIGGINFLISPSPDRPYERQTAPIQKPQFDISQEAGEQSLDNYWLRSQTSWHRGQGVQFYEPGYTSNAARFWEPGSDLITEYRYNESVGVDVWTRDKATLLYKMNHTATVTAGQTATVSGGKMTDGTDCIWTNENGVVKRRTASGTVTNYTPSATTPVTRVAVCGSKIAVGHGAGIDIGDVGGSTLTAQWTQTAGTVVVPFWAKQRIIAAIGNNLWSLPLTGTSAAISTAGTNIFTHPDPNFVWTSVTDGPNAIYAAGYGGGGSQIFMFSLQDASSGTLPKLSQGYEVSTFPTGELVNGIKSYLGGYIGIATTRGVRVGTIDTNGHLNYGPLIVETDHPCVDIAGNRAFIYATVEKDIDGNSGCLRVNLGQPLPHEDLRFAYAWDAQTHSLGAPNSLAFFGDTDQVCIGVNGEGIYTQDATHYESTGYILSGRIRFKTTEYKLFRSAIVRTNVANNTSVALSMLDENSAETTIYTINSQSGDGQDVMLSRDGAKHEYLSFRTTLNASADGLSSPTLYSLLIKAVPAVKRQRLVQYPLLCSDREQDSTGVPFGYVGFGWSRLNKLEAAESDQVILTVQDFTNGETYDGMVEQLDFRRTKGRAEDGTGNFGGILIVTMRILN